MSIRMCHLIVAALVAVSPAAKAHDFFLVPHLKPGNVTTVSATIGSAFPTPEIVVTQDRIASATARALAGMTRIEVAGPKEKALELSLDAATGPTVVGVALKPRDVEYGEDRIDLIMGEYQVSAAAKANVAALPRPRTLKVDSRRFAKTIVCRATCEGIVSIPAHDFELEFVPVKSNLFRLMQTGSPLADYPVNIAGSDGKRHEHRSNAAGDVEVGSDIGGRIMLFASTLALPAAPGERFILRLTSLTAER